MSNDKNPLHEKALRLSDLKTNLRIVVFKSKRKIGDYRIKRVVPVSRLLDKNKPMIHVFNKQTEDTENLFLSDIGVIKYHSGGWHATNYTLRHSDA